MTTLEKRLNVPEYKQWMKGGLVLKHLQAGIADYVDDEVKTLHGTILNAVKARLPAGVAVRCVACNNTLAKKKKWICSSHNICTNIRDELKIQHEKGQLTMGNIDVSKWTDANKHWEVGKCYCSPGYTDKQTVNEIDCSGLLCLISNCKVIKQKFSNTLTQPCDIFEKVREIRNKKIMHSADLTLQNKDLDELVKKSLDILQEQSKVLINDATIASLANKHDEREAILKKATTMDDAASKINEIHKSDFTITPEDELEILGNKVESLKIKQVQHEIQVNQRIKDHETAIRKQMEMLKNKNEDQVKRIKGLKTNINLKIDSTKKEMKQINEVLKTIHSHITVTTDTTNNLRSEMEKVRTKTEDISACIESHRQWTKSEIDKIETRLQEIDTSLQKHDRLLNHQGAHLQDLSKDVDDVKLLVHDKMISGNVKEVSQKDMMSLQKCLLRMYKNYTDIIPLSPYSKDEGLPIQKLFTPVIVEEDLSKLSKAADSSSTKPVNSYHDLLYQGEERAERVFMIGSAGRGKSTYCLHMLDDWRNGRNKHDGENNQNTDEQKEYSESNRECPYGKRELSNAGRNLSDGEKDMLEFEFLFFVSLRHVDKSRTSVIDMICNELLAEYTRHRYTSMHVLKSMPERCLVIVDGLDEWSPTSDACSKLRDPGFPNRDNLNGSLVFMTSRPCKLGTLRPRMYDSDKLVNIKGIGKPNLKHLVKNVLIHHCGIVENSEELSQKTNDFLEKSRYRRFESLLQIPLVVTYLVSVWHEKGTLSDSLVQLYLSIIECLLRKSVDIASCSSSLSTSDHYVGKLKIDSSLSKYVTLLRSLGKIAFESLMDEDSKLVFSREEFEKKVGEFQLKLSLRIGLICQSKVPGRNHPEYVSISFFHKTMQEFLAAVWLASDESSVEQFISYCSSKVNVCLVSNTLRFASGLDSNLYSKLGQRLKLTSADNAWPVPVTLMMPSFESSHLYNWIKPLNDLQCDCYLECVLNTTEACVEYPMSYVAVDEDNLNISADIVRKNQFRIEKVSINFWFITKPDEIDWENLRKLLIEIKVLEKLKKIVVILPDKARYDSTDKKTRECDLDMSNNHELRTIELYNMCIRGIKLPFEHLQKLVLNVIDLSGSEDDLLQQLSRCTELTALELNTIYNLPGHDLELSNNHNLQSIQLWNMTIENFNIPVNSLQELSLRCLYLPLVNDLSDQLPQCSKLRKLDLKVQYTDTLQTLINKIPQLTQLKKLKIEGPVLGRKGIKIELSSEMSKLTDVSMSYITMTSDDWYMFVATANSIPDRGATISLYRTNIESHLLDSDIPSNFVIE